jgi:hypothetical protein
MSPKLSYRIQLQPAQLKTLQVASESLVRIHLGQFDALVDILAARIACPVALSDLRQALREISRRVIPLMSGGDEIGHPGIPDEARVAWDLAAVLRQDGVVPEPVSGVPLARVERDDGVTVRVVPSPRVAVRDDGDG